MTATAVEPTPDQLSALTESTDTDSVVMLNLLRFKDRADGIDAEEGITGREAYERYAAEVAGHLQRVGGEVIYVTECLSPVIAPEDETWDLVALVRYPSRQAFLAMISDPDYQASHGHRAAALSDSRLVCCQDQSSAGAAPGLGRGG